VDRDRRFRRRTIRQPPMNNSGAINAAYIMRSFNDAAIANRTLPAWFA
jgi:hypothetical protein